MIVGQKVIILCKFQEVSKSEFYSAAPCHFFRMFMKEERMEFIPKHALRHVQISGIFIAIVKQIVILCNLLYPRVLWTSCASCYAGAVRPDCINGFIRR
jgi:hypothetical protein